MKIHHVRSAVAAVSLILGGVLVFGAPAYADNIGTVPSGCGISPTAPSGVVVGANVEVRFGGSAHCGSATSISYRLVHNYATLPDARVTSWTIGGTSSSYISQICDNGGPYGATTPYYSEIALNGTASAVQRVSKTVTINHC